MPKPARATILQRIAPSDDDKRALFYKWKFWARPSQLAPLTDWDVWLVCAGRGFGKTRTGAEWVIAQAYASKTANIALIGATTADAREVMIEGESGILASSPPWFRPVYLPSKLRLTWPNGARARAFSAEKPNRLRGPQFDFAWCDEIAAWQYPDAYDQLQFGLRLGAKPRAVVTTTPRPTPLIRQLLTDSRSVITTGSTYDNRANLAASYFETLHRKYEGTRLGRQEIYAELLGDTPGALWNLTSIDIVRVRQAPVLKRIVVAIDPAVTSTESSDETGIIVVGVGEDDHGYVLADLSGKYTPAEWAKVAVVAFKNWKADRIVAETNNGGDLVETNIRTYDKQVPYKAVHASRGKRTRAEPVASLYEQGKVHHVGGFAALEDTMTTWDASGNAPSPDRMDALVWGLTELMLGKGSPASMDGFSDFMANVPRTRF